jgi:hypothetical protein
MEKPTNLSKVVFGSNSARASYSMRFNRNTVESDHCFRDVSKRSSSVDARNASSKRLFVNSVGGKRQPLTLGDGLEGAR